MFSFSFLLFCSTWNIFKFFWKRFLLKAFSVNFFICEIFNEWKFFHRRPPPYYILRNWLKKLTWKRFHFLWIFSHCKRFHSEFFHKCNWEYLSFSNEKFSSQIPEPPVQEFTFFFHLWIFSHWKRFQQYVSVFICENFHNCDFVKKITMKAFTIVKYFTKFLSISKLFRNVSVYSLVFVRYCEGFHKVPRKMLQPYNYGSGSSCKRFQVSSG